MASQNRRLPSKPRNNTILSKLSESQIVARGRSAACEASNITKKLLRSTGRAAWIAGTTFLVIIVPLIIQMDREAQMNELEQQQNALLGTAPQSLAPPLPK